jgi:AraC-like DNA-binding protein
MPMIQQATSLLAFSQLLFTVLFFLINYQGQLRARPTTVPLICLTVLGAAILLSAVLVPVPVHWLQSLGIAVLFPVLLFLNLTICRPGGCWLTHTESVPTLPSQMLEPGEQLADDYHVEAELIRHAMEAERLYADPGLTIGRLASHLGQQEYRLRRLINRKLGYRNFNHCLNHYRIAEVAHRLCTCEDEALPIAAIARSAGFASLTSFNKAFREIHGVTPSKFRNAAGKPRAPKGMST